MNHNTWLRSIVRLSGGLLLAGVIALFTASTVVYADDWCQVDCGCATLDCGGTDDCQGFCDEENGTCLQLCGEDEQWIYCSEICPEG